MYGSFSSDMTHVFFSNEVQIMMLKSDQHLCDWFIMILCFNIPVSNLSIMFGRCH